MDDKLLRKFLYLLFMPFFVNFHAEERVVDFTKFFSFSLSRLLSLFPSLYPSFSLSLSLSVSFLSLTLSTSQIKENYTAAFL